MEFVDLFIKYRIAILAIISAVQFGLLTGCAHFQDELSPSRIKYAKTYKEIITSHGCADGSIYYKYHIRLIGFVQAPFKYGYRSYKDKEHYDTLIYDIPGKVEARLLNKLKNRGLYLNDFKYVYDDCGDLYIIVWGSPKPSSHADQFELNNHKHIQDLIELKKEYTSITNEVPKCECRYCTSGLNEEYWR